MRSWLAILVTLVACNDHGAGALTAVKTKVCACKTASCAEQELKRVPERAIDSNHRTQTIARDMLDCLARLQAAERPVTDPDAEGSDEPAPPATSEPAPPARPPAGTPARPPAGTAPPTARAPAGAARKR